MAGSLGGSPPSSSILVAEACEYDRSFHNFHPTLAVILNVEEDHLDCYSSLEDIVESFAAFARKLPPAVPSDQLETRNSEPGTPPPLGGFLLINHEMPHRLAITAGLDCAVETIGFAPQADWRVEIVTPSAQPETRNAERETSLPAPRVRLHHRDAVVAEWASPLPGDHMAYNAAAAAITAHRLGADWETIGRAIAGFQGLDRRMQRVGIREFRVPSSEFRVHQNGATPENSKLETRNSELPVTIVDDYGHHPTEVDTTLRALRQHYRPHRLICVFQPHQHSRTRFLMKQFAASFSAADIVIVPHIYFVRDSEQERHAVTAGDLVDHLRRKNVQAMHLYPFEAIVEQLEVIAQPGDLVVTMGAGDVWKIAHNFLHAGVTPR